MFLISQSRLITNSLIEVIYKTWGSYFNGHSKRRFRLKSVFKLSHLW